MLTRKQELLIDSHLKQILNVQFDTTAFDLMFFDPGQDPDDEQAMLYLYKKHKNRMIWVFCPNDKISQERMDIFYQQFFRFFKDNSPFNGNCVYMITKENYFNTVSDRQQFNRVLICSPIDNILPNINVNQVFVQGSLEEKSFNTLNSENFLKHYRQQGILFEISSKICAKTKPTIQLLNYMNAISDELCQNILLGGARCAIGRMHPEDPKNIYAETIINPEIKENSGINYKNILTLYQMITGNEECPQYGQKHRQLAIEYVNDLERNDVEMKLKESTINYLSIINSMLDAIFPSIWEGRDRVITSSDDFNKLKPLTDQFIDMALSNGSGVIPGTMPCYDLFAATIFSGFVFEDNPEGWKSIYNHWYLVFN